MTQEHQPGKKWTVFIGVVATFVLLVLLVVSVWTKDHRAEDRRVRAEIQKRLEAIRAAGEPVTSDDLAKMFPDPPPEHDASNLLAPAFAAIRIPDPDSDLPYFGAANLFGRTEPLDVETKAKLETLLKVNQAALAAVPWDKITNAWIGSGFGGGFPNKDDFPLTSFSPFPKLLCLSAVYHAELGHGAEATRQLCHGLALARVVRSDTLIHHLFRRMGEQRMSDGLERVINRVDLTDDDLSMLARALADNHPVGLREALMSERCDEIWIMKLIQSTPGESFVSGNPSDTNWVAVTKTKLIGTLFDLTGRVYRDSDLLDLLDFSAQRIAALRLPPKERFAEFQKAEDAQKSGKRGKTFAAMLIREGGFIKIAHSDADQLARLQVAQTAIAIERWRLSHEKRPPDSLSDLAPDYLPSIPLDSFDGQPLRYKKLARGYLVYSIGSDLKDDGGKEKPAGASGFDGYDITFTVEH